jgi:hypothetical protein
MSFLLRSGQPNIIFEATLDSVREYELLIGEWSFTGKRPA